MARRIALDRGSTVLDVASGTGDIAIRVARRSDARGKVIIAGDICPAMLAIAKRKAGDQTPKIDFRHLNAHQLTEVPDSSVDAYAISFGMKICDRVLGIKEDVERQEMRQPQEVHRRSTCQGRFGRHRGDVVAGELAGGWLSRPAGVLIYWLHFVKARNTLREGAQITMEVVMRYGSVLWLALILAQFSVPAFSACAVTGSYAAVAQGLGTNAAGALRNDVALAGIFIFNPGELVRPTPGAAPVPAGAPRGTVTRSFTLMYNGVLQGEFSGTKPVPDPGTVGTYTYGENGGCSAKLSFPNSGMPPNTFTETYTIYFTDTGDTIYFINTTPGIGVTLTGQMNRR